jgi:hypothetical protein
MASTPTIQPEIRERQMKIRPFIGTIVACAIVGLLTAQMHSGFLLLLFIPFFVIWLVYSVYVIWRHPAKRMTQAIKAGLWLVVIGAVLLTHWRYAKVARDAGDAAVAEIIRYKTSHGTFPATPEAAGLKPFSKSSRVRYFLEDGKPKLFYPATFVIFDTYWYDFEKQSWEYRAD